MNISSISGSSAALQYAHQSPPAMKGEATQLAAQVAVTRKAMEMSEQAALSLIETIPDVGRMIDVRA